MRAQRLKTASALIAGKMLAVDFDLPAEFFPPLVNNCHLHDPLTERQGGFYAFSNPSPRRCADRDSIDDNFYAEAEVPGLGMDDLEVFVVGNELTIKGRWNAERDDDQRVFHRRERERGDFTRVLTLPVEIDAEKVGAVLKDGVLTVTLPKAETARTRKIAVKSA